jgi:hypothetical protein
VTLLFENNSTVSDWQSLTDSVVRLIYLRVYDNRTRSPNPVTFPSSLNYSLTLGHSIHTPTPPHPRSSLFHHTNTHIYVFFLTNDWLVHNKQNSYVMWDTLWFLFYLFIKTTHRPLLFMTTYMFFFR